MKRRFIFVLAALLILSGCGTDVVYYHGQAYDKAELSQETIEWLEWFNAMPEEDQNKISYMPPELWAGVYDAQTEDAPGPEE